MNPAILFGHLKTIAQTIGERPAGSLANRQVMEYIGKHLECLGYPVTYQLFDCVDWKVSQATCFCMGNPYSIVANPYSPSCNCTAPMVFLKDLAGLRTASLSGTIATIHGSLAKEPLMPKSFPFYQPEEHQEIIRILEEKKPEAVLCICPGDRAIPVITDGDFSLPSCTISQSNGSSLLNHANGPLTIQITSVHTKTRAANVICQIPGKGKKIVLCAHFDSKYYTSGALDNASGVAALMVLADRLRRSPPSVPIEFIFFNGEECYHIPGEIEYFSSGYNTSDTIRLAINIDGVGLSGYRSSIAYFSCLPEMQAISDEVLQKYAGVTIVDPWPQGDHMIFALKGIPAIAFSTAADWTVMEGIIHTREDTMDHLDIGRIMHTVDAIESIVRNIAQSEE